MDTNQIPHFDDSVNTTGCCAKFNPNGWDGRKLHFEDKDFVRAITRSALHVPINMGKVFSRVQGNIDRAGASSPDNILVLSRDLSPWKAEHLFAVSADVPQEEKVALSGDFMTKVFEGPFRQVKYWYQEMLDLAGKPEGTVPDVYFFYTTCPKCAEAYGQNYVVGVVRTDTPRDTSGSTEGTHNAA